MSIPPSIQVTTRDDLSLLYRLLRAVIRPLRPRLANPGKPLPAGSPKLTPPSTKCSINERQSEGVYLYDFTVNASSPRSPSTAKESRPHQLYYFVGGGFQSPPSPGHWKFCAELCQQLGNAYRVTLVSYPLAPNSPAPESLPVLQKWLLSTVSSAALNDDSITLMGDSSGGNIALSLGFWSASTASINTNQQTVKNIFAICPAVDLRNENTAIADADNYDPILTVKMSSDVGKAWAGTLPLDNPEVSPIFSDPDIYRRSGIKVHGVIGTHDILAPDATKFREALNEAGVSGEWLEWKGQMHCFPIAQSYGLRESKEATSWIVDVLRRHA